MTASRVHGLMKTFSINGLTTLRFITRGLKFYGPPRILQRGSIRVNCLASEDQQRLLDRFTWPANALGGDAWPHIPNVPQRSARPISSSHTYTAVTYSVPSGFTIEQLEQWFNEETRVKIINNNTHNTRRWKPSRNLKMG